ncbi:transmembrane emp24 domain-containing protein p24delta3-like [Andrographis paniculata]|uniref:transmembrane emp24 domain-containing protein p24delta3-like n=1 Tax=Andrographis paniculata TaxID=175694 RepID=UPI0021E6E101|nr:transmembrane emp24 domain-containing protein p24delta3-like [Andrographis paniculata]
MLKPNCRSIIGMKLAEARLWWTVVVVIALGVIPAARGLWIDLPSSGTKCVSNELRDNVVVLADYYAFIGDDYDANSTVAPAISAKVTSPFGNTLHHQEKVSHGQFSFTTTESGSYLACFTGADDHNVGKRVVVGIDWKIGIATKDWDSIAKKEKIEGLELELRRLEDTVEAIHKNLYSLIQWEEEMRGVSEKTNARVARCSIISLTICIVVSVLQVLFLRRYFRQRKLI